MAVLRHRNAVSMGNESDGIAATSCDNFERFAI